MHLIFLTRQMFDSKHGVSAANHRQSIYRRPPEARGAIFNLPIQHPQLRKYLTMESGRSATTDVKPLVRQQAHQGIFGKHTKQMNSKTKRIIENGKSRNREERKAHYYQAIVFKSNIICPHPICIFNLPTHLVYLLEDCTTESSSAAQNNSSPCPRGLFFPSQQS